LLGIAYVASKFPACHPAPTPAPQAAWGPWASLYTGQSFTGNSTKAHYRPNQDRSSRVALGASSQAYSPLSISSTMWTRFIDQSKN